MSCKIAQTCCLFVLSYCLQAQETQILKRELYWTKKTPAAERSYFAFDLTFANARYHEHYGDFPVYAEKFLISTPFKKVLFTLSDEEYESVESAGLVFGQCPVSSSIGVYKEIIHERGVDYAEIRFIPIRFNSLTGSFEKLKRFTINLTIIPPGDQVKRTYAAQSVLSTGEWFKAGVRTDGIYKFSYASLQAMGINMQTLDPRAIRIFGNGGGMVPQSNAIPRADDLLENAIFVSGEGDGTFDAADYILFYGQSPDRWYYNLRGDQKFHHKKHLYSDTTFYFLTTGLPSAVTPPKRISSRAVSSLPPTHTVTSFNDYRFYENDRINFIKSGKEWYGEAFDLFLTQNFDFNFPNIAMSSPVYLKADLWARYPSGSGYSSFNVTYAQTGQLLLKEFFPFVGTSYYSDYAAPCTTANSTTFTAADDNISIILTYNQPSPTAIGFLNYLELNARRNLVMNENQMLFRDVESAGWGNVSKFVLSNVPSAAGFKIWDVTNASDVTEQLFNSSGSSIDFTIPTDSLLEFIAFNGLSYLTPVFSGKVENQNLHGLPQTEMIIIAPEIFLSEANRLADFHRNFDNLSVHVVEPAKIYKEFSSGAQDVSGIRDFIKMFYDRAFTDADKPKYLLLFGDGSYDNKNRVASNTNFIPTFHCLNSYSLTNSYVSDDFYALLEDHEGAWESQPDDIDLAVGRFPCKSIEEAKTLVDKTINYSTPLAPAENEICIQSNKANLGDWRNVVCFVADDQDGGLHLNHTEQLAVKVTQNCPSCNLDKIYFDAFQQVSTPGGQRYPEAQSQINKRVDKGALIVNYVGHGGELGLAHESVVTVPDINSWSNGTRLPAFMTATCEFTRWDDPGRTSAGEYVLLNANGGGIALFTTTRLAYAGNNQNINLIMYNHIFNPVNGVMPRMGDVYRLTKQQTAGDIYLRNFTLMGDPAVRLSYPDYNASTSTINSTPVTAFVDTLGSLSKVTISGSVTDKNGQKLNDFNGIIYPTVFDKKVTVTTLGNDGDSPVKTFLLQKNIIYKGKSQVTNGDFSFTFIIPKDISYQVGLGRISYYAHNGIDDAAGNYDSVLIGGPLTASITDNSGPQLRVYMNDERFVFGSITNASPVLYGVVNDENGINTVGTGIGHDITAKLDNNSQQVFVLNDYYEADMNSYQSGKIIYPLEGLSEGRHRIDLKVWDILNNSSETFTEFIVAPSARIALQHVLNYPNPFTTHTEFFFEHNQPCNTMLVHIQIYTVSGKLIKTINDYVFCEGFRTNGIPWDGKDDFGDKIGRGTYVYSLKVRTPNGEVSQKFEKLVILN